MTNNQGLILSAIITAINIGIVVLVIRNTRRVARDRKEITASIERGHAMQRELIKEINRMERGKS